MAEGLASQGPSNPMGSSPQPGNPNFFACRDCGRIYNKSIIAELTTTCKTCGASRTFYKENVCPECVELEKIKVRDALAAKAEAEIKAKALAEREAKDKEDAEAHAKQVAEDAAEKAKADAEARAAAAKTEAEARVAAAKAEAEARAEEARAKRK